MRHNREVNDGRGPADFKISRGARDKTIVEFKLAKNTQLTRQLRNQAEIYQKASDAKNAIKVIVYCSNEECRKLTQSLKKLDLYGHRDIVMIDAIEKVLWFFDQVSGEEGMAEKAR